MSSAWPSTIPAPANGLEWASYDPLARTGQEIGASVARRRFTQGWATGQKLVLTPLTSTQKAAFETFFNTSLVSGGEWFTADWLSIINKTHHQGRIIDPVYSVIGANQSTLFWSISFDVEIRDVGELISGYLHPWYNIDAEPPPDTDAPVFSSAAVDGATLVMAYTDSSNLDAVNIPATSAFAVLVDSSSRSVSSVAVDATAKTVTLTLSSAVTYGQTVTVAYTDPTTGNDTAAIQDVYGNDAATLTAQAVTNNTASTTKLYKGLFGYGNNLTINLSITNKVSDTGIISSDTSGVGTARLHLAAANYGTDKAIFGYGYTTSNVSLSNLVSNTGVVSSDTTGVGTARGYLAAASYGGDKAIFGYGLTSSVVSLSNLVSNTGVVASDITGVGTARRSLAAVGYGTDKAIFGYGYSSTWHSMTNLVSNTGVISSDTTGVGSAKSFLAAAGYGTDKAIFGYGSASGTITSITNLVSNTGVVSTDTVGVGTARYALAACQYGADKAIFGYGLTSGVFSISNLVSNTGVVASDITGVGTARYSLAAASY